MKFTMKFTELVILVIVVGLSALLAVHYFMMMNQEKKTSLEMNLRKESIIQRLNETYGEEMLYIKQLEAFLRAEYEQKENSLKIAYNNKLQLLQNEFPNSASRLHPAPIIIRETPIAVEPISRASLSVNNRYDLLKPPNADVDNTCEAQYGLSVIDNWKGTKESWCYSDINGVEYTLDCYPYHQVHKKRNGKGQDMFCEARNIYMDFSKIKGEISRDRKPNDLFTRYFNFEGGMYMKHYDIPCRALWLTQRIGSILSPCKKTAKYAEHLFMPHQRLQMNNNGFATGTTPLTSSDTYDTITETTYLLTRDEDFENSFHSAADFMNMFLVMQILGIKPTEQQILVFDRFPNGAHWELWQQAFAPNYPLMRRDAFGNKKVLFKRLIFHLESPAALIHPEVADPGPLRCFRMPLFTAFRRFVLQAYQLYDVAPPAIPSVLFSQRRRIPSKNLGRILANEPDVLGVLREGNMMNLRVVDLAELSFKDQLAAVRHSNIIVGIHGAGLMNIMFAAEEAILVEIHPSYRLDRHFRHAARMTGKIYMPVRSQTRETCQGTSDNVMVPIDEFRRTMDGAMRIARNFDDGLAECGLNCPGAILSLDRSLDGEYSSHQMTRAGPQSTHFPC